MYMTLVAIRVINTCNYAAFYAMGAYREQGHGPDLPLHAVYEEKQE